MLREAGFRSIDTAYVEDDIVNTYYICRVEPVQYG